MDKHLEKQAQRAQTQLRQLRQQTFVCAADAQQAAHRLADQWPLHQLSGLLVERQAHDGQAGRPAQGQSPSHYSYHLQSEVVPSPLAIAIAQRRAGRFILATNVLAALAFVMGLALMVYTLTQRRLRQALAAQGETIPNQLGKPAAKPTLRWVFMCFQSVHLL